MRSPYSSYPQGHQDVFNAAFDGGADLEAARRQSELGKQSKQFAQQYALQGLQNDIASQSQQNKLIQGRMDGVYGPAGNILRGLFN